MNSDREVINNILRGNKDAFRILMERYQKLVCYVVFKMIKNPQEQQDISQEVFLKIYRNLNSFKFNSKLSTWIAQIAYNTCIDELNRRKIDIDDNVRIEDDFSINGYQSTQSAQKCVEYDNTFGILIKEIDKLPARFGVVLSLFHLQEMSYHEIAAVMNLPEGTVKSYLFRGRKMLKKGLESKYQREEL
ncbi:MAG: sigma-70 family RNA polymerase sigma factor [candidate division Zixibacteria bacterium]|nr:sigma-70 family RNA polymerase sigma factor [candidate division Zixibacteria bacterium]